MPKTKGQQFISRNSDSAFSLVEVILAIAIFMILAVSGVTTVLHSFSVNKLGEEYTNAVLYAQEGLEAVRSIKNRSWGSLASGTYGLTSSGGSWAFLGTSDIKDKYTRQVVISDVERDGEGNIVENGGVTDPDTLRAVSSVTWNFSGTRDDTVSYDLYLTNFRKTKEGILLYSDGSNIPKWRNYSDLSDSFDGEADLPVSVSGLNFILRSSPDKREAVAGIVSANGELNIFCYDGSVWSWQWAQNVGGNGSTKRFDISYETSSGDAVVVYNNNNSNQIGYRTKSSLLSCGESNWSGGLTYSPLRTSGVIHWLKAAWDRRTASDLFVVIWADANSDLSAAVWSGTSFVNEPSNTSETSLEVVSSSQDVDDFDVEFESLSGDIMVVWANSAGSNGSNGVRYRTCTGGTQSCTWGSVATPPTFADDAHNLDISSNPLTDEIVFASVGYAGCDMQIGYWNGSAWTNRANVDSSVVRPSAGTRLLSTGWTVSGSIARSIIAYHDATNNACSTNNGARNIGWYTGNSATFSQQSDFAPTPLFTDPQSWYEIHTDPIYTDRLILFITDSSSDLFAKKLFMTPAPVFSWSDSDGGTALETDLSQTSPNPFGFAYWRTAGE